MTGKQIAFIVTGSPAGKDGQIRVGDEISCANGVQISDEMSAEDVWAIMRNAGSSLSLELKRGNILSIRK
jgi:C-terminal processing protease CtpA/Prc